MAKALKIVGAVVIGVGLIVATAGVATFGIAGALSTSLAGVVSAGTLLASGALITAASSALTKVPSVPSSQVDRLTASIVPRAPRTTVLSETAMATDIRYQEWFGDEQEYCGMIVAVASHKVESVDSIWINDELAWAANSGVQPKYVGYFYVQNIILEGTPDNTTVISGSGKWNTSHRLTGCAYVHIQFRVTGVNSKATSPFSSGIPSRMTIVGKGAMLYDPRRDSTVPGGNGPMRVDDQTTWRYVADDGVVIGRNTALHALRVLLGWKIQNPATGTWKLATGSGMPARRIDLQSFLVAANLCDEQVNRSAGGTEPRYETFAVVSEADEPKTTLDMLCAACSGRFRDTGGKLAFVIMHNDLADAATDDGLNDDDVMGAFTWNPDPSLEQTPNLATGSYTDPSTASLYQLIPYPDVKIDSLDGIDRILPMTVAAIESPSQAQRVVKQALERKQYDRSFTAPFDIRAWKYPVGRLVPFTFAALGFQRRLFRVAAQEPGGETGLCNMTLQEENAAIYAWDADDAPAVTAAEVIKYDSANNPLILAIGEAADSALWTNVVDNDPVSHPRPADGATVGAPAGTMVVNRPAEEVLSGLDINAAGIIAQALRQDDAQTILDARTFVEGQSVNAVFEQFRDEQLATNSASEVFATLLGVKSADGTAIDLNMGSLYTGPDKTLGQHLDDLEAANGLTSASVQTLKEVLISADGSATARAVTEVQAGGTSGEIGILAGLTKTLPDGSTKTYSSIAIKAGITYILNDAGDILAEFGEDDDGAFISKLKVDTLDVNTAMKPILKSDAGPHSGAFTGSQTTNYSSLPAPSSIFSTNTFNVPKAGLVLFLMSASMSVPAGNAPWSVDIAIDGAQVAMSYRGGNAPDDTPTAFGFVALPAGDHTASVRFAAHSSVTIQNIVLIGLAFPATELGS